jgi:hypothetical protein
MTATLLQIARWAEAENLDPAAAIQEYLAEKDSRVSLAEARRLLALAESKARDERLD